MFLPVCSGQSDMISHPVCHFIFLYLTVVIYGNSPEKIRSCGQLLFYDIQIRLAFPDFQLFERIVLHPVKSTHIISFRIPVIGDLF